jgi:hypothetical protein
MKTLSTTTSFRISKTLAAEIGLKETLVLQHFIELQLNGNKPFNVENMSKELIMPEKTILSIIRKLKSNNYIRSEKIKHYVPNEEQILKLF